MDTDRCRSGFTREWAGPAGQSPPAAHRRSRPRTPAKPVPSTALVSSRACPEMLCITEKKPPFSRRLFSPAFLQASAHRKAVSAAQSTFSNFKSHTPCPNRSPRRSNLVIGRSSGRGT
ncbi:hypothetical protein FGL97_16055 [Pseudomonas putida]|nr:hypothetical protein [Pseudomonas putida]NVN70096.1 hypothetical protein [Pseudomonas putida]